MARKINEYRVRNGQTKLDEDYFNKVLGDIDTRIHAQEVVEKDWQGAIRAVTSAGLRRINDFIGPAITEIEQLTDLGFLQVRAAPDVDVVWQAGAQPIALALDTEADRTRVKHFHPSPFLVVSDNADPAIYLIARTIGLDVTRDDADVITGAVLRVDVQSVVGSPAGGAVLAPWCVSSPAATALLVTTTEDVVAARDDARHARTRAVAAETNAAVSETAAAASAASVRNSETNAHASALAAAQSATGAENAANALTLPADLTGAGGFALQVTADATGYNLVEFPSAGESWTVKSIDFTAGAREHYAVDTSGGSVTATLPANPATGDPVHFTDAARTWGTNALILDGNGNDILNDMTFTADVDDWAFSVAFNGIQWVFGSRT